MISDMNIVTGNERRMSANVIENGNLNVRGMFVCINKYQYCNHNSYRLNAKRKKKKFLKTEISVENLSG